MTDWSPRGLDVSRGFDFFVWVEDPFFNPAHDEFVSRQPLAEAISIELRFAPSHPHPFVTMIGDELPAVSFQQIRQVASKGVDRLLNPG